MPEPADDHGPRGHSLNMVSLRDYVDTRLEAVAVSTTLQAAAIEKRLDAMNEFRESLRDQAGLMATRIELEALCEKVDKLENWRSGMEGKASQDDVNKVAMTASRGNLFGVLGILLAFLSFIASIGTHYIK